MCLGLKGITHRDADDPSLDRGIDLSEDRALLRTGVQSAKPALSRIGQVFQIQQQGTMAPGPLHHQVEGPEGAGGGRIIQDLTPRVEGVDPGLPRRLGLIAQAADQPVPRGQRQPGMVGKIPSGPHNRYKTKKPPGLSGGSSLKIGS
jgi:hypothetical protein